MARGAQLSASLLLFSLGLVILCFTSGTIVRPVEAESSEKHKTWCVAKPSADAKDLQVNIDKICANMTCSVIQPGGPCYKPDNLVSHASVALNLYYAYNGRNSSDCDFGDLGVIVKSDPSYDSCTYF